MSVERQGPRILLNLARPRGVQAPVAAAEAAVVAGVDGVGFADSPRMFPDPFLTAARVLSATGATVCGPCVLGLGLHHPAVVAQALATLAEQHPGRTMLAVARGESSLANEDLPVPSLAAYRSSLERLRARLDELEPYVPGGLGPVIGAASGPRTIAVNAGTLGGVLLDVGAEPTIIARAVEVARTAAPEVRCWLFVRAVVTETEEEATAAAVPILGSCATRLLRSPQWYDVAPEQMTRVGAVAAAHDYRRHGTAEASGERATDAGIDALIRDRFVLTGSGDEIIRRLRPLATLGIEGIVLAGATAGIEQRLAPTAAAVRAGFAPSTTI
ncbi:LLM class flavin-dependent oxidoreductase [Nocardioides sp. Iso805N]|uniref:LLM class flavin-dependent oxidoreductase n=1 Tax=Nocardioides sp. Iso805N TaxID=1283287 RepID=UPI0003659F52|nr:LLM class flavin-dependent oxidoreductase [Nocardioides sp. Iso805N]